MSNVGKNQEQQKNFHKEWAKIVAKAWSDETFKERLLKNPMEVLKENGVELPPGVQCKIYENSDKLLNLTLPLKPSGQMSEESLQNIAGGASCNNSDNCGCHGCL